MTITLPSVFGGEPTILPVSTSTIAFEDSGPSTRSSPAHKIIYCLPGIGDLRHSYRFLAPKLVAAGHRVICQDLRGTGDSGTKFDQFGISDCSSDISAVLDHLQIQEPVVIIGNSLCAAVAVTFAADHPSRVDRIVTMGGFFRNMPGDGLFKSITPLLFNGLWGASVWISAFRGFFAKPPADLDTYCAAVRAQMLSNCDHAGVIGSMIRASKEDAWIKVAGIKCPVLLLMGSKDPDFKDPNAESALVAAQIEEKAGVVVRQCLVEGVGHYPQNEAPEETFNAVVAFLTV
ncbi:hypothetical protein HDU98_000945 [Podochytrium sp. JEL0797]|nr:hypothetical protein HDU98_000945 [Podochytrium sp. JEL0797]